MEHAKELSGVNKKCAGCKRECKQYEQVVIGHCPQFEEAKKPSPKYVD